MELALLRTLTSHEFYKANRNLVKEKIFRSKETRTNQLGVTKPSPTNAIKLTTVTVVDLRPNAAYEM